MLTAFRQHVARGMLLWCESPLNVNFPDALLTRKIMEFFERLPFGNVHDKYRPMTSRRTGAKVSSFLPGGLFKFLRSFSGWTCNKKALQAS